VRGLRGLCTVALVVGSIITLGSVAAAKSTTTTTTQPTLAIRKFKPGECVTWHDDGLAQLEVKRVDCATPHIMEMVGVTKRVNDRNLPSDARWTQLFDQFCRAPVERYLNHPIDPMGRYAISGIEPLAEAWADGDHNIRCSIGARTTTSAGGAQLVGKADPGDQSLVWATGTCIGKAENGGMIMVDCTAPHFAEATGTVALAGRFDHAPTVQETFDTVGPECASDAETYLGRQLDPGLAASVLSRDPASWNVGSTTVTCIIARFENGDYVDLPGPLR
jgi:hypothetical protein